MGRNPKEPCPYCGERSKDSFTWCRKHGRAIRMWIQTEGKEAAYMWLDRLFHKEAINEAIARYDDK